VFFGEIDALVLLTHRCVVKMVEYCLGMRTSRAQTGIELTASGSQREALPILHDPGKATVIFGLAVGMEFIHSRAVIPRDLEPANILLDEPGHPEIGDLVSSGANDLRLTIT
jgi:serine/threonine protein kinase